MSFQNAVFNFRSISLAKTQAKDPNASFPDAWKSEEKKDKDGNVIDIIYKRPPLTLSIPALDASELIDFINVGLEAINKGEAAPKEFTLILDTLNDVFYEQARSQVDDNPEITQETLDNSKLTWSFIANIPQAERGRRGIPKETWEAFAADYVATMGQVLEGVTQQQLATQAAIFTKKLEPVKTNKPVLTALGQLLDAYLVKTENAETFNPIYELLSAKVKTFLEADEQDLIANLGLSL